MLGATNHLQPSFGQARKLTLSIAFLCGILTSVACRADAQQTGKDKSDTGAKGKQEEPQSHARLPLPSAEAIKKLPKDGGPEFNRLIFESSPYLLQHARNEVNWYPWGPEAFAKAKKEGKAVFLSVGYSTCHWCHVMERESFENKAVAALLNQHFVAIKVDREERPDVDNIYMAAVQAQTGRGGWPMSVFMTPQRKPFWGGTYFPPEDQRGRPGFKSIIKQLAAAYKDRRKDVLGFADRITDQINQMNVARPESKLNAKTVTDGLKAYVDTFDGEHGGFGKAPKFPRSHSLSYLLRIHDRTRDESAIKMVRSTLGHMTRGGIHDHLGGGFHRYSTDREWLVPHFEKMLYDQALLARSYLEAYQVTNDESYAETARDIFDYVLRDMTDARGGFYSAEDADSEGEEGKFYVWTRAEVIGLLGKEDGELFCKVYQVSVEGNFRDEALGKKTGANILHRIQTFDQIRSELKYHPKNNPQAATAALKQHLNDLRGRLFAERKKRIHPLKDDKILTDWNGLMISALAYGGQVLADARLKNAAVKAATFITETMKREGRLLHRYRQGNAAIDAYLDDYAFLSLGLLDLYETTFDPRWLAESKHLAQEMVRLFWDEEKEGFFFSGKDAEGLISKTKEIYDGAVPSGNSVATLVLLRLGHLTSDKALSQTADNTLDHFSGQIAPFPTAYPFMMMALDFSVGPKQELVIAGSPGASDVRAMQGLIHRKFLPRSVVAFHPTGETAAEIEALVPFIKEQVAKDGKATAYVCEDYTCQLPTTKLEDLGARLREDK